MIRWHIYWQCINAAWQGVASDQIHNKYDAKTAFAISLSVTWATVCLLIEDATDDNVAYPCSLRVLYLTSCVACINYV